MQPTFVDSLLTFLGRCHLLVLHFPIALVVTAAAIELFRARRPSVSPTSVTLVLFAALGAAATAGSGWLYAEEHGGDDELFWHRWLGVASAAVILLAALFGLMARGKETGPAGAYRWLLLGATLLVSGTGHIGGELVNGEDFFVEPFRSEERAPASSSAGPEEERLGQEPPPEAVAPGGSTANARPVDFASQIQPLFERSCYECHGPTGKAKGGLRLSDVDYLFDDDPDLAYVLPGNAAGSLLVKLVSLSPGEEGFMPKKGEPLSADEIALVRRWIDEGADY